MKSIVCSKFVCIHGFQTGPHYFYQDWRKKLAQGDSFVQKKTSKNLFSISKSLICHFKLWLVGSAMKGM